MLEDPLVQTEHFGLHAAHKFNVGFEYVPAGQLVPHVDPYRKYPALQEVQLSLVAPKHRLQFEFEILQGWQDLVALSPKNPSGHAWRHEVVLR